MTININSPHMVIRIRLYLRLLGKSLDRVKKLLASLNSKRYKIMDAEISRDIV
jgi:hypothetical protein